jgi:hypothetical protein
MLELYWKEIGRFLSRWRLFFVVVPGRVRSSVNGVLMEDVGYCGNWWL